MRVIRAYDLCYPEGVLRGDDVYVEIGACRGKFLLKSELLNDLNTYHLIEPQKDLCASLHNRFPQPHVRIHNLAIDDRDGVGNFAVVKDAPESSSFYQNGKDQTIETQTLETWMDRENIDHIRFLAMNCEQSEYDIIRHSGLVDVDFVAIEFHPGKSGIDTAGFLKYRLPNFETLAMFRQGEPYNVWLGKNRNA